ncbi:MAG: 3-hydroxyisobutyrate dehydrogenase [Glaciecola sp.]
MSNITFFGLGNMGAGMASNLLKAGHKVTVYDLVPAQVEAMVKLGAIDGKDPSHAVVNAEVVISMLPAGKHVQQLYSEILPHVGAQTLFIDCSTIQADTARELHQQVNDAGFEFVDAPVSGGVAGAAAGTLTFIMGGTKDVVDKATKVLSVMGKHCFHAGDAGAGQVAKICNNMLLAVLMAGTSEALQMAMDNGLDPAVMSEIMKQSSGNNWALQVYNPVPNVMPNVPSSNGYQGGFMVDLMNKDLGLAMAAANTKGSVVPMGSLAQSLYQLHGLNGNGDKDFSSIFESLQK